MSSITTRVTAGSGATVKNAPLSNAEIDNNFINLNVDKAELASTQTFTKSQTFNNGVNLEPNSVPELSPTLTGLHSTSAGVINISNSGTDAGSIESGNLTMVGSVSAYSDVRLKTDLQQIQNALEKVTQLTGYTYTRIDTNAKQTGLLAQDVQKVMPEAVMTNNEYLSVAYGNLIGLMVEAIKELNDKVDALGVK